MSNLLHQDFLWGASTAPHQVEGNNVGSDWWRIERQAAGFLERSGDALDSYHRYPEDMRLLAEAGLNAYRFGIEWARIEPEEGHFSRAALAHYRRMIDTARQHGLAPVVTVHHFTNPVWFADEGGWAGPTAVDRFARYVERAAAILTDVDWICTINEPNILALMSAMSGRLTEGAAEGGQAFTAGSLPIPDIKIGATILAAHKAAVDILRARTSARVGWTVAQQSFTPTEGNEEVFSRVRWEWEDFYLEGSREDDFVGTQAYTSQPVGPDGPIPHPESPDNTLAGWAYRPDALGMSIRHAAEVTGLPVLVTENGIATGDDERRIRYTREALAGLLDAVRDGVDVRGYLHWTAMDNYEWGHWAPTFGLIAVDRETFERRPKPSLAWLGEVARTNGASLGSSS